MNLVNCKLTLKNVLNKSTRLSKKESNAETKKVLLRSTMQKTKGHAFFDH